MRWLALIGLLAACGGTAPPRSGKLRVVATTGMVADLARAIGGDLVEVDQLMGSGVDPHLYKATAGDLERLRAGDVILYSGRNLEGKMGDVFAAMARRGKTVVAVTESVPEQRLLEMHGGYDPHLWFDVALWAETTGPVAEALSKRDADHAALFGKRAAEYRETLLALHEEVRREVATIEKSRRVLITSHDAFRYFGRAYDIEVAGLQGISTVTEAGVADVQRLVDLIVRRGVKAVFVETSVSDKAIRAVREAVRQAGRDVAIGGTLYSDAMGDKPPEDTYVGMVRANVRRIVEALR